ncbi:MAG TPA: hypothetical protein VFL10_13175, partial [Ornithinibacter sp.]|nr:hypothetical protein [Ornithinibacter sp.]
MPSYLDPEQVHFELVGGVPTVTLTGAEVTGQDGWSILGRPTLVVVDGPGDEGFLVDVVGPTAPTSHRTAGTTPSPAGVRSTSSPRVSASSPSSST